MKAFDRIKWLVGAATLLLAACATMGGGKTLSFALSGGEEVPPVTTPARGSGTITVAEDMSVTGRFTVSGLSPTMAHIHVGKRGANGPVAIWFDKAGDNVWAVRAGARFNEAQYKAFLAGETYVNVHTEKHKPGEIRAQLQP